MRRLFFWLTGGRPMIPEDRVGFMDIVSGLMVNYYRDQYEGKLWMANTRWSLFRVEATALRVQQETT